MKERPKSRLNCDSFSTKATKRINLALKLASYVFIDGEHTIFTIPILMIIVYKSIRSRNAFLRVRRQRANNFK